MTINRCISRRQFLSAGTSGVVAAGLTPLAAAQATSEESGRSPAPFRYCLNMGTIMGQRLTLEQEIETAAKAGYDAIEPWLRKIQEYRKGGGSPKDLRKRLADAGLTVEGSMSFPSWAVDDEDRRARALEQLKSEMEMVAEIGGKRIAAPPVGVNRQPGLDLMKAAERYRAILEIGDQTGVTPALEIWGPSRNLSRLGEAACVAAQCGHPKACLLLDVYHIYKGGSDFHGLKVFSNRALPVFHMNDYPADPPRESIQDRDRVFPGDGVAPLSQILRDLYDNGGGTVLSLELFNPTYWKQDALTVARTGLEKMKAAAAKALG